MMAIAVERSSAISALALSALSQHYYSTITALPALKVLSALPQHCHTAITALSALAAPSAL